MDTDRKKKIISSGRVTAEDLKKGDIDPNKSYIFDFENKDQKKDNKQGVSQNDQQKELSELKQEVENLKKKAEKARMEAENINLQIYSTQKDKNEQPIADENMQKQSDKAFDEWLKINSEYRKKLAEYNQKMAERENKKKQQRKNENLIKENLNQTIYSDGVNTYRGKEARQAYSKHLENKENKEKQKKASATKYDLNAFIKHQIAQKSHKHNKSNPLSVKEKITNKKRETRERENRKQFGFKNPLYPNKLEMIDYMFAQREARKSEDKLKSRTITKPLINERKQRKINQLYNQMTIKNIDNNRSQSSIITINAKKAGEKGKIR